MVVIMANLCFKCGNNVGLKYQIVPLEVPYVNVFFCRDCFGIPADDNPPPMLLKRAYAFILDNEDRLKALLVDVQKRKDKK